MSRNNFWYKSYDVLHEGHPGAQKGATVSVTDELLVRGLRVQLEEFRKVVCWRAAVMLMIAEVRCYQIWFRHAEIAH